MRAGHRQHFEIGKAYDGQSGIQIWYTPDGLSEVVCVLVMCVHGSNVVNDLSWCPSCTLIPDKRLGILAAAMGDGSIQLFAVPHPKTSVAQHDPITVDLPPAVCLISKLMGSSVTIPRVVSWRARSTGPQLLAVGFDSGDIAVWNVSAIHDTQGSDDDHLRQPMTWIAAPHPGAVITFNQYCAPADSIRCRYVP